MRLGLFGGTFNPIHIGHLRAAEEVRESLSLDKIIFVPSYMPPHKDLADNVDGKRRLDMVRLAVKSNTNFEVSSFEVDSGGNSYSILTIEHIRETCGCTPYFILGQDAFNEVSLWYRSKTLFDATHFAVMSRPDVERYSLEKVIGKDAARFQKTPRGFTNELGNEIVFVEVTAYAVSSSQIRKLVKQGRSIRYLVSREVHDYIRDERIYI
ncbi:MAG TPA: nicotinate-nucleotide adenylyltransferase [Desulfomonilia bacterium]|nr:nicotinate-nucleotide adenylyltransferase [Desulfomonilia bacterium]